MLNIIFRNLHFAKLFCRKFLATNNELISLISMQKTRKRLLRVKNFSPLSTYGLKNLLIIFFHTAKQ